ncbi:MAG: DUF418 domain-containing protein [Bacteroidota bacterium]
MEKSVMSGIKPTTGTERLVVLDALRGFALFGILFANLYSFMGFNTISPTERMMLPVGDRGMLFFIDWFIEGKFYGIFSILFGVGFALQAERFRARSANFFSYWYRRMVVLCCIGLMHMFLIWNGDILTLYAVLGMFLPLFLNLSDRALLRWILVLLSIPLVIHGILYFTYDAPFWGVMSRLSADLQGQWGYADRTLFEMRTSDAPVHVFLINVLKAIPRPMSYLLSGRYFQVLGLFLIGLLLARHWLPKLRNNDIAVPRAAVWIGGLGLVAGFGYAWTKFTTGSYFGVDPVGLLQGLTNHIGSTSLALGIAMLFVYTWASGRASIVFRNLALLGRMALTNYIFQNIIAVLLFFGYGLGLMNKVPYAFIPLVAFGILAAQWAFSRAWLRRFKQGPLEFIWRKLSYRKEKQSVEA